MHMHDHRQKYNEQKNKKAIKASNFGFLKITTPLTFTKSVKAEILGIYDNNM